MSYTLTFENLNEQDIIDYEKTHNVKFVDFIENLIKPRAKPQKEVDCSDIYELSGKYQKYAKGKSVSIEEMDRVTREEFAKKWMENEKYNYSND